MILLRAILSPQYIYIIPVGRLLVNGGKVLKALIDSIKPFDTIDLLSIVGALQLEASNANHAIRIEALAHAISCIKYQKEKPTITKHRINQLLTTPPLGGKSQIPMMEDPCNNIFTEAFTFYGGSYIVFPGILHEPTYILKHLNKAIFFSPVFKNHLELQSKIYHANNAILSISNEIANRAGLIRNLESPDWIAEIIIPDDLELKKNCVVFTKNELGDLLGDTLFHGFEEFVTKDGSLSNESYSIEDSPLHRRPIVEVNDLFIISEPWMLLAALRHRILSLAFEFNLLRQLAREYRDAVSFSVEKVMNLFDFKMIPLNLPESEELQIIQKLWSFDTDKVAYSLLISDDLDEFDINAVFGYQPADDKGENIVDHLKVVEEHIYKTIENLNEIFFIIIHISLGRHSVLGFSDLELKTKPKILFIGAYELELISCLESNKSLLYKFVKASSKWKKTTKVISWSTLGEFEIYRNSQYSFYLDDNRQPDMLTLGSEFGRSILSEALTKFDSHSVFGTDGSSYIEVVNLHKTPSIPIYSPLRNVMIQGKIEIFVETSPSFWICVNEVTHNSDKLTDSHPNLGLFADMVSYWLWQFRDGFSFIGDLFQKPIVITLDMDLEGNWDIDTMKGEKKGEPLELIIETDSNNINVIFLPQILIVTGSPDNSGELECMSLILRGISELLSNNGLAFEAKEFYTQIDKIISPHLDYPQKKKILSINANIYPQLQPFRGRIYRKVSDANKSFLLDDLGDFLTTELNLPIGPIPKDKSGIILNDIVSFYYVASNF